MFFRKAAVPFLGLLSLAQAKKDDDCLANSGGHVEVHVQPKVHVVPVEINNYFEHNTVININGGPTININNAPIYFSTVVSATTTQNSTSTVTVTNNSTVTVTTGAAAAPSQTTFVLAFGITVGGSRRATTTLYVGDSANAESDVSSAVVFNFDAQGRLTSNGRYISAGQNVARAPFVLSSTIQAISTNFFNNNGFLGWENDGFSSNFAQFYYLSGLVGSFFDGNLPNGATLIQLIIIPTSQLLTSSTTTTKPGNTTATSAPSSIRTTTPAHSTSIPASITSSHSSSSFAPFPVGNSTLSTPTATGSIVSTPTGFALSVGSSGNSRRAIQYVGAGGALVSSPADGLLFNIDEEGRISNNGQYISASKSDTSVRFTLSSNIGDINAVFSNTGGSLDWANSAFTNGVAQFYITADNIAGAFFDGHLPPGGRLVTFAVISAVEIAAEIAAAESAALASSTAHSTTTSAATSTIPASISGFPSPTSNGTVGAAKLRRHVQYINYKHLRN